MHEIAIKQITLNVEFVHASALEIAHKVPIKLDSSVVAITLHVLSVLQKIPIAINTEKVGNLQKYAGPTIFQLP